MSRAPQRWCGSRSGWRGSLVGLAGGWMTVVLALVVAGCWDTPSREWYHRDGGPPDEGMPDGGCDASCCDGSACGAPDVGTALPRERMCDDELDNDDDGNEDCADPDCAAAPSCCADGQPLFTEEWTGTERFSAWTQLPRGTTDGEPSTETDDDTILLTGWEDSAPHALMLNECVPLALGAELSFDFKASSLPRCTTLYVPCDEHAALVLSRVDDTSPGLPLFEDLAIRVHADARSGSRIVWNQGMLQVTQGGEILGRINIEPNVRYTATLIIAPSTQGGVASLRADVELRLTGADRNSEPLAVLTDIFLTTQQGLVRGTSGCMEVGGLYAAPEMVGAGAQLGPLRAKSLSCANPSQFQPVPMGAATLTSTSLGVPPGYGGAHVGAPTLGSSFNATTDVQPRWDLLFEATNQAPELDDEAPVGYAIAHSRTTSFGALAADWTTSASPRIGSSPPSCLGNGETCSGPSVRDPFLLMRRRADDVLLPFTLAFAAREQPNQGHTLRVHETVNVSPAAPIGGEGTLMLAPDDVCHDLRHPALLPVEGGSGGYWLFFTCVPSSGVTDIRVARLDGAFGVLSDPPVRRIVTPAMLGSLGAGGVFGAEPIVRRDTHGLALHVWLVALDGASRGSVVLVTGRLSVTAPTTDGGVPEYPPLEVLPTLEPYLANPVLRSDDAVLGGCPGLACNLTGVAVSDTVDDPDVLRFVVARRVAVSADASVSELLPLTQTWRSR